MDYCVECHVCHQWYDIRNNSEKKYRCNKCYKKEWKKKNKEKVIEGRRRYRSSDNGKKQKKIDRWKEMGLICDEYINEYGLICDKYDQVYQLWLDSTHCDKCGCQYTSQKHKHMDHCHKTGRFRAIVCVTCNQNMLDKKKPTNNTSGHKNISYHKNKKKYEYRKTYYGKTKSKLFKRKVDALCFKYIMLLRLKAGHFD